MSNLSNSGERLAKAAALAKGTTGETKKDEPAKEPAKKTFDKSAWDAHLAEQVEKASKDAPEVAKARLATLAKGTAAAKEAFTKADATITVEVFEDAAAAVEPEGIALARKCVQLAHALRKGMPLRSKLIKARKVDIEENGETSILKSMDAVAMLEHIGKVFGIDVNDPKNSGDIAWKVHDAIRVIENAARLQTTMANMAKVFGKAVAKGEEGAAAEGEGGEEGKDKGKTGTKKRAEKVDWSHNISHDLRKRRRAEAGGTKKR